ncbi:hypothetical protein C2E21_3307 [Chlorella sorokiniana]|uniref:BZIP domain-containing protein n=1 Tax=Chlorella sorokiniana TaxID=3076 RepID=A0A2P6TU29_CHLSO|nr:hypothetical protein C2E21_3307 [Chlorella sorokiniana]|eukprot:PRW57571.1 hypothetical protein C2E21_3307 [Chlorella sorokiniana]
MDGFAGAGPGWGSPPPLTAAPWGGVADLEDFSWFGSAVDVDLAPLLPPMPPVGGPPPPLAADPLGQQFDLLLAQPQDASQQQWAQQLVQPQYQQQSIDLPQAAPPQPAAGGGARTGRRAAAADAEEARRARNRAAQARFREKQKAKDAALVAEHAAKSEELERKRQEAQDLAVHAQVLQKALDAKDVYIAVLGAASAAEGSAQQAQQAQQAGQPAPAPAQDQQQQQQQQEQQQVEEVPVPQPPERLLQVPAAAPAPLPRQPSGSDLGAVPLSSAVKEQLQRMSIYPMSFMVQMDLPPTAHPDETMAVAVAHQEGAITGPRKRSLEALVQDRPDLLQQALQAPPEDLVEGWRRAAAAFKEILERFDATGRAAELEQIHRIFRDLSGLMAITLHYRPENAQALFATAAQAPPGHWERIAACLEPTQAQRATLRHMWRAFAGQLQAIRAERAQAMQAAVAASGVAPSDLPASTLGGVMSGYLALFEATGRLNTLQDEEFIAMLQLLARMGAVFSPIQKARLAAASSPYFPDSVQLVRLLAEGGPAPVKQQGEQQQQQLQQQQAEQQRRQEAAG